jgi:heterodisulfide reductase subunit A
LEREPQVAGVDEGNCSGCFHCERACAYGGVERKEIKDRQGRVPRLVAFVNAGVCQGCGTCAASCPSKCVELQGFTDAQVFASIQALFQ